jgi:hypothetical protein
MLLPVRDRCDRLPKSFPVGARYVVEGRGGETGDLRVFSRYVVLPNGQRINLAADGCVMPVRAAARRAGRTRNPAAAAGKARSASTKKIVARSGTAKVRRR